MILPIYAYGHPVLRRPAEDITADYPNLSTLLADMWETMYYSKGMGLAAPQIGKSIRLFLVDTTQLDNEEYKNQTLLKQVFINAEIIAEAGTAWSYEEGCLSIPDVRAKVSRQPQVRLKYLDEQFQPQEQIFDGITARVIQHEYDHLEGILFTDHLGMLKKQLLSKQLSRISKGDYRPKYKMIYP